MKFITLFHKIIANITLCGLVLFSFPLSVASLDCTKNGTITTCSECVEQSFSCVWCPSQGGCYASTSYCDGSIYNSDQCPSSDTMMYALLIGALLIVLITAMCICKRLCRSVRSNYSPVPVDATQQNTTTNQASAPPPRVVIATFEDTNTSEKKPLLSIPVKEDPPRPPDYRKSKDLERLLCDICSENQKDVVLGCGHILCEPCLRKLNLCPYCKDPIKTAQRVYL